MSTLVRFLRRRRRECLERFLGSRNRISLYLKDKNRLDYEPFNS